MEEGPWIFRGMALMLEEFDGSTSRPKETPNKVIAWIQIHRIPHLFRPKPIIKQLGAKVGEVLLVETRAIASGEGDFHRVRVMLHAAKPLPRVVTLAPESKAKIRLQVKYEKLPRFCGHCGLMGHVHLECGTGEYKEEELEFGAWMVADQSLWHPGTPRFRPIDRDIPRSEPASRGGRGGMRGGRGSVGSRGACNPMWRAKQQQEGDSSGSRKRGSADVEEDGDEQELADTASSPSKPKEPSREMGELSTASRQLVVTDVPPLPQAYKSPREVKRARGGTTRQEARNEEAGSVEEARQAK